MTATLESPTGPATQTNRLPPRPWSTALPPPPGQGSRRMARRSSMPWARPIGRAATSQSHLWRCGIDGGNARQLTFGGSKNGGPVWSPDGASVAFTSDRVEKPAKQGIFVLPTAGGESREVTSHAVEIFGLAWSPDGAHLAYIASFDPDNPDEAERPADAPPGARLSAGSTTSRTTGATCTTRAPRSWSWMSPAACAAWSPPRLPTTPIRLVARRQDDRGEGAQPQRDAVATGLIDVATGEATLVGPRDGTVALGLHAGRRPDRLSPGTRTRPSRPTSSSTTSPRERPGG